MSVAIEQRRSASFWLLVALVVSTALLGRLAYLAKPFDHDGRMFIYLGKLVCDGGRFYHDVIDNKFPSVGLMTSVWWRGLGAWWPGYVLGQAVLSIVGALLLGRMAGRTFGEQARMPAILFAMVAMNFNAAVFGGFQLETMQTFFAILAAGAALEAIRGRDVRDAFVVGLAAGCAAMFKPSGVAVLGAFGVAMVIRSWEGEAPAEPGFSQRRRLGRSLALPMLAAIVGLAIPGVVVVIYLVQTNLLGDMPALYRQIARYAAQTPWQAADYCKPFVVLTLIGFPVLVRAWVGRREKLDLTVDRASRSFVFAWLVLEMIGIVMQRRMYAYHFLPVAAPAALLFAMWPRRERTAPLTAALLPLILISVAGAGQIIGYFWKTPQRSPVSDYLLAHAAPSDAVWQDSIGRVLLETNLKPGARIPLTFLFLNHDNAPLEYGEVMLRDFDERRPRYIVLPMDLTEKLKDETTRAPELFGRPVRRDNYRMAWQRIEQYVKAKYQLEAAIDGQMIYRRSDAVDQDVANVPLDE